jgi:hypothetical protein
LPDSISTYSRSDVHLEEPIEKKPSRSLFDGMDIVHFQVLGDIEYLSVSADMLLESDSPFNARKFEYADFY